MKRSRMPDRKHPMERKTGLKRSKPKRYQKKASAELTAWKDAWHTCIGCRKVSGRPSDADCSLEPHHRLKVSKGGDDSCGNLGPLCWECHRTFHAAELHPKGWKHGLAEWIRTHAGGDVWKPGASAAVDEERARQLTDDWFEKIAPCTDAIDDARFDQPADYFAERGAEFRNKAE